jgi:hypothetical protein
MIFDVYGLKILEMKNVGVNLEKAGALRGAEA